jgi:hypothetical protein
MGWSRQKSTTMMGTRLTVGTGGVSLSREIGLRLRLSLGKRGITTSFKFLGFWFRL